MNTTILVVDENQSDLNRCLEIFDQDEYTTHNATCGTNALALMDEHQFSVIVIDICMSSTMTGLELIQTIRADKRFEHTPIIITGSGSQTHDVRKAVELGVNGYVLKSHDETALKAKFRAILSRIDC